MKTLYFLIGVVLLFSCNKSSDNNTGASSLKAKFVATANAAASQRSVSNNNVIAELDIKSYNAKTGEVVFDKLPVLGDEWMNNRLKLNMYKNGTLLFGLTYATSVYSYLYNEPVIYWNSLGEGEAGNKWYILDGYPAGIPINTTSDVPLQGNWREERDASVMEMQSAWSVFIHTLKSEGKYIE